MAAKQDLTIKQGSTFTRVLRWESPPYIYKAITGITKAAPAVVTAASHGIPDGWRVAVVSVKGMTQINAKKAPPADADYTRATFIDSNSLELNEVNSTDYGTYTSGGYLQLLTPVDLSGYTGRMKIKDKIGGTVLASTDVGDAPNNVITITLDNAAKTITVQIDASDTASFTWTKGVYDLEMVSSGGVVTDLLQGKVTVELEVTT
jgi:hypothetical protein